MKTRACLLARFLLACSPEPQPQVEPITLAELMKTHYALAQDIRDALINGYVVSLYDHATELANPVPVSNLPDAWAPHLDSMRSAAKRLIGKYRSAKAASGFADLAPACANCHQMTATTPAIKVYPTPDDTGDIRTHRLRHAWDAAPTATARSIPLTNGYKST